MAAELSSLLSSRTSGTYSYSTSLSPTPSELEFEVPREFPGDCDDSEEALSSGRRKPSNSKFSTWVRGPPRRAAVLGLCAGVCVVVAATYCWQGSQQDDDPFVQYMKEAPIYDIDEGDENPLEELDQVCQDTPGWTNGWTGCAYSEVGHNTDLCALQPGKQWPETAGYTCRFYEQRGICRNGQYKNWAMGRKLNSPEQNCCACKGFKLTSSCSRETGGSCRWTGVCSGWRGPTNCESGKCLCKPGYCGSTGGTCMQRSRGIQVREKLGYEQAPSKCETNTGGTCMLSGCGFWRGPTECSSFKCHCKAGYCSDEQGGCYKNLNMVKAEVIPINSMQPNFPGQKVTTALAVSGGGSRALSAALGVFRALRDLDLITSIDAISSVSGGSWASSILMFAPIDLNTLLGKPFGKYPHELDLETLDESPPPLGSVVTKTINDIALSLKLSGVPFGMLWVASVAKAFLEPFGLNRLDAYLAASPEEVDLIRQKNPQFKEVPFMAPQAGRAKTIIINSAVLAPPSYKAAANTVVNIQISPDFSGSPYYPDGAPVNYKSSELGGHDLDRFLLGGGMISTYAFGSAEPTRRGKNGQMGGEDVMMHAGTRPMSLARAVGWSSAAFGAQLSVIPGIGSEVNPRVEMWPVTSDLRPRPQKAAREMIGDGGNLENTGILAAMQRGASRIVACIASPKPLVSTPRFCSMGGYQPTGNELTDQFANLFGYGLYSNGKQSQYHEHSQVFDTSEYIPALCELQKLQEAGRPLVLRRQLTTVTNRWWGIEGGRHVDIVFILISKVESFEQALPSDTRAAINSGAGLANWPYFKTTFQNMPDLTAYTARQVNLLSSQMEWAVHQNEDLVKAVLR